MRSYMRYLMMVLVAALLLVSCQAEASQNPDAAEETSVVLLGTLSAMETRLADLAATPTKTKTPKPELTATPETSATVDAAAQAPVVPASTSNVDASQLTSTCDSLTFLADITIPDNVDIPPKTTFKKTWAVRNNGLCTWNSNYAVVWVGGDQLGAPASAPILEPGMYIRPGEMALITVTLKAPDEMNRQRNYTSNWKLRNDKGQNFGWGPNSDRSLYVAFWASYYYSFLENQCSAVWSNSDGALYCPGSEQEPVGGYVYKDNPQLENGFGGGPSFYIVPPKQENGQVSARFAPVVIPPGSVWKAEWNCAYGGQLCNFHATVTAVVEGGAENLVGEVYKYYDGLTAPMDIDLKNYEGQAVAFTITVDTNGGPEDDRIILRNPRIEPK